MRKILILLLIALSSSCALSKNKELNDLEKENLKGNVRSVATFEYKATTKFGEVEKGEVNNTTFTKNHIKIYNDKGNIEEELYFFGLDPLMMYKYYYNDDNDIDYINDYQNSSETFTEKTPLNSKTIHKYNQQKQLISKNRYDKDGSVENKEDFFYDEYGILIKSFDKLIHGTYDATPYKYEYTDSTKKIIRHSPVDTNLVLGYQIFSGHNEIERYNKNDATSIYTRDKNGDIVNTLIKLDDKDIEMNIKSYYKYDEKGNWIVKIDSAFGIPSSITHREINYSKNNLSSFEIFNNSKALKDYKNDLKTSNCNLDAVINALTKNVPELVPNSIRLIEENNCEFVIALTIQLKEYPYEKQKMIGTFKYTKDDFSNFIFNEDLAKRNTY